MSRIDFNQAKKIRDRRLRKALLVGLYESRGIGTGEIDARTLLDVIDSTRHGDQRFSDDGHAMALIRDLVTKGLVRERLLTRRHGQALSPEFMRLSIEARGVSLIEESIEPDPDIDDDRAMEE